MARIDIFEKDYSMATTTEVDTVVYIPGMPGSDWATSPKKAEVGVPVLLNSLDDMNQSIGTEPLLIEEGDSETAAIYDKSYIMAKQLLAFGMKVLYEIVGPVGGDPVVTIDGMHNELPEVFNKLNDKALYGSLRFITSGAYGFLQSGGEDSESRPTIIGKDIADAMVSVSMLRGDCFALVDHDRQLVDAGEILSVFKNANITDGEYASAFTPWCEHSIFADLGNAKGEDGITNNWYLPGSFSYLVAYANSMNNNNPSWYSIAGVNRGQIPTLIKPVVDFGETQAANLQERTGVAINPICFIAPYGYRIWGNRTLVNNAEADLVYSCFLNVRNLCSDIKKLAFQSCRRMTFEQNSAVLWTKLSLQLSPLLDKMMTGNGIDGYKLEQIPTNTKAKLMGRIRIVPIEAVEDFELYLELTDSLELTIEG